MGQFDAFGQRRKDLSQKLPEDAIALIPAASEQLRNGDAHYRFRQDSNFYYLTGSNEADSVLLVLGGGKGDSILFNLPRDSVIEQWTGKRMGQEAAISEMAMQGAYPIATFKEELDNFITNKTAVYCDIGHNPTFDVLIQQSVHRLKEKVRRGIKAPEKICDLAPLLSEMRLIKTDSEIAVMRKAAEISVSAHKRAMQRAPHLDWEYELEAELHYEFTRLGCRSAAYDSIVGGGENACILHYTANNAKLEDGQLILIDAGGEYQNYASDITRTFPKNGRFSAEQRALYELVLEAQKAGIATIKPDVLWHKVQEIIVRVLVEGLCALDILHGNVDDLIAKGAYKPFYMHSSGHWLGLDVHDAGQYKIKGNWRPFKAGMVLTVEPGLYMSADIPHLDPKWHGMGIRIEDDILVTSSGYENLTGALPSGALEIEELMRG